MNKTKIKVPTKEVVEVFDKQFDLRPDDLNLVKSLSLSITENDFFSMLVLKQISLNAIEVSKYKIHSYKNQNKFRCAVVDVIEKIFGTLPLEVNNSGLNKEESISINDKEDNKGNKYRQYISGFKNYISKAFSFNNSIPISDRLVNSFNKVLNTEFSFKGNKYKSLFLNMLDDYKGKFIEILYKDIDYDKKEIKYNNDLIYLLTRYNMPISRSFLYTSFTDWLNNPENKIDIKDYSDTNAYFKIAKNIYLHNISVFINKEKSLWSLSTYNSISSPIEEDMHFASLTEKEKKETEGKSLMAMVEEILIESTFNNGLNLIQMINESSKELNEIIKAPDKDD